MSDPTRFEIEILAQAMWAESTRPAPTVCKYSLSVHGQGTGGGGAGGFGGVYTQPSTLWADQPLDTRIVWRRRATDLLQEDVR